MQNIKWKAFLLRKFKNFKFRQLPKMVIKFIKKVANYNIINVVKLQMASVQCLWLVLDIGVLPALNLQVLLYYRLIINLL